MYPYNMLFSPYSRIITYHISSIFHMWWHLWCMADIFWQDCPAGQAGGYVWRIHWRISVQYTPPKFEIDTPQKFDIDTKHGLFERSPPFPNHHFGFPCWFLGGVPRMMGWKMYLLSNIGIFWVLMSNFGGRCTVFFLKSEYHLWYQQVCECICAYTVFDII